MKRLPASRVLAVLGLLAPALASAHDLQYRVISESRAVTLGFFYPGDLPFNFESYEISRVGESVPVQVGRTDHRGRLAFLPDGPGEWRVRAFTEDGHGVDFRLTTGADSAVAGVERPIYERYARVFVGLGVLLGVFGLLSLFLRGRRPPADSTGA